MTTIILLLTSICLIIPIYVYVGYPMLLLVLSSFLATKKIDKKLIEPMVTLLVSCYNEVEVIRDKIDNSLALDYPKEMLEIIFVSDGSDDGTDEVIKEFRGNGIKLIRQEGRLGKTSGLNLAMPVAEGEIIVFSDANAIYEKDAIEKLVRNFNDKKVGYVVGAALYTDKHESASAKNEGTYWNYEIAIKKMESKIHSVVGGDGAIYAIRKSLYTPLNAKDINDFVNPLQIIAKGYRGVFESKAICYEKTAGSYEKEGARKERIVNRSIRGLMAVKQVMNPFVTGIFSLMVVSHKLLRWLVPFFLLFGISGSIYLSGQNMLVFQFVFAATLVFFLLIVLGYFMSKKNNEQSLLSIPYYFAMVNIYSMKGVSRYLAGETQVTWNSSRSDNITEKQSSNMIAIVFVLAVYGILCVRLFLDVNS